MKIFEISRHEFSGRFSDPLPKEDLKIWLVNDSMAVVVINKTEIIVYGDTNLSDDEEYELLCAVSPNFETETEKVENLHSLEEYEKRNTEWTWKYLIISGAPILVIGLLVVIFSLMIVIF